MPIEIFRDAGAHDLALTAGSVLGRENRDCALTLSPCETVRKLDSSLQFFHARLLLTVLHLFLFDFTLMAAACSLGKHFSAFCLILAFSHHHQEGKEMEGLDCNQKDTTICSWTLMWNKIERFSKTCNKFGRVTRAKIVDFEFCRGGGS